MARSWLLDPRGNVGSDLLLISQLNARWPERYRANTQSKDASAKEVLSEIREMHWEWREKLEKNTGEGAISEDGGY